MSPRRSKPKAQARDPTMKAGWADDGSRPLTPREDQLARNHAAVIERLQREGVPIPTPRGSSRER